MYDFLDVSYLRGVFMSSEEAQKFIDTLSKEEDYSPFDYRVIVQREKNLLKFRKKEASA